MKSFDNVASLLASAEVDPFEALYNTVHSSLKANSLSEIRVKSMAEVKYLEKRFNEEAKGLQEGEIHITAVTFEPTDMSLRLGIIYKISIAESHRVCVILEHRDVVQNH